jgi:hypothetical protein
MTGVVNVVTCDGRICGRRRVIYRRRLRALLEAAEIGVTAEVFMIMKDLQSGRTADPFVIMQNGRGGGCRGPAWLVCSAGALS